MGTQRRHLSSSQMIILGFAGVILFGSVLMMLPFFTKSGKGTGFADALFTVTSAVCVTGLVVQDTASYWNLGGQFIILLLIQIGGMGVITVAVGVAIASGRTVSLKQRSTLQEAISAHKVGGIVKLTGFILRTSAVVELLGAVLMMPVFCKRLGLARGIWYAVFHSVSAFCNAGFDLMGVNRPYSSMTGFSKQPVMNIVLMALIIIGGIGFLTWDDMRLYRLHLRKYHIQSKVILLTALLLILLPAYYFFCCEFNALPMQERLWQSVFQAVTPRTAGFNTANIGAMSEGGLLVMIILMLIGGAPGSTAGGMKLTTFAVMLSTTKAVFCRREHTQFFGRRISNEVIRSASTIVTMYLVLFLSGGFLISRWESLPLLSCLYETASALGTVGLTVGITPTLGLASKGILILLMYIGRVGGLTLIFSALSGTKGNTARLPQEKLTVG